LKRKVRNEGVKRKLIDKIVSGRKGRGEGYLVVREKNPRT